MRTVLRSVCAYQCECECNFSILVNEELFKMQPKFISRLHMSLRISCGGRLYVCYSIQSSPFSSLQITYDMI